jgi:hypothetical protein
MPSYVQLANLDFAEIKETLKDYLRSQSDFTGYDFEGSAMSVLLDVLAYNTYYTAFNTNMVANELFLDSATLRDNVVSLAKTLGYQPRSRRSPVAYANFAVNFPGTAPNTIILKRGSGFNTIFDDILYTYVAIDDIAVPVSSNFASFTNVPIYEGKLVTNNFIANTSSLDQRFIIDNQRVDTTTIRVRVFESEQSTSFQDYEYATNVLNVSATDAVFFLEEVEDERYEIFFGDGSIGRALENGNRIQVSYLITNGPATNGARTFTFGGVLEDTAGNTYPTTINVDTVSSSDGGENLESISSIKYNAPKFFGTQDRAVTADDFAAIIVGRGIYPAIGDIITYGGEEEVNPEYGKVKIVIKPRNSAFLSQFSKNRIIEGLKPYMIASVTPEIIDPSILYVELTSKIFYNKSITTTKPEDIKRRVITSLEDYISLSDTEKFNGKFRYSKFTSVIDNADRVINSNETSTVMRKDFYPVLNSKSYYELCYQNEFAEYCGSPIVRSTGFRVSEFPATTVYFEDIDGKIVLYTLGQANEKVILRDSIGRVDYEKGEIMIDNLTIIKGSFFDNRIEVRVDPLNKDLNAVRNVYLDIDITKSTFNTYPE